MWAGLPDMVTGYGGNNGASDGDGYIVVAYIPNSMKIDPHMTWQLHMYTFLNYII